MYEKITSENVVMFAIKHYDNPQCEGEKEFQDDLKRFKYIKRLLRKYYDTGVLKERLLLNHLIVLLNVFGADACATLLLYKIQSEYWSALKSFALYLNMIREDDLQDIEEDKEVLKVLEEL
jgi:hypothetical protein